MKEDLTLGNKPLILQGDCLNYFKAGSVKDIDLTYFDPPYNQGKDYGYFNDKQEPEEYWNWINDVLKGTYKATVEGGEIYKFLQEKHPELNADMLAYFTRFFSTSLFANLENSTHLNILSSLEIPTIEKSKYKPISTKYQLGLDAEIYTRLLETVILILKKKYEQSSNFKTFLEETKDTSMIITVDLKTDFYRVMENFESMFSKMAQHITKE